jgi:hypothetical protein
MRRSVDPEGAARASCAMLDFPVAMGEDTYGKGRVF